MAELVFLLLEFVFVILVEVILSFCMQVCMLVIVTPILLMHKILCSFMVKYLGVKSVEAAGNILGSMVFGIIVLVIMVPLLGGILWFFGKSILGV